MNQKLTQVLGGALAVADVRWKRAHILRASGGKCPGAWHDR